MILRPSIAPGFGQGFLLSSVSLQAQELDTGDRVWGEWNTNEWYQGAVVGSCEDGYQVGFDDGDEACLAPSQLALDVAPDAADLTNGIRVVARWGDTYFPGVLAERDGEYWQVNFDDGDSAEVNVADVRPILGQ